MRHLLLLSFLVGTLSGCNYLFWDPNAPENQPRPEDPGVEEEPPPPPPFDGTTVTVTNWNLEWFGHDENGPSDEAMQQATVAELMQDHPADLWAVQEVSSPAAFDALLAQLPGYEGTLSSDPGVSGYTEYLSEYDLRVGLIYRTDVFTVLSAKVILRDYSNDFAGRPPLEVRFRVETAAGARELIAIVLHLKAEANCYASECWTRRKAAADALKVYLDTTWPAADVLVLGDWNDDVDTSIVSGEDTPFRAILDDVDYRFVTKVLSDRNEGTTVSYASTIDHQLATNELAAKWIDGSTTTIRPRDPSTYRRYTSDHYPVRSRFSLGE